MKKLLSEWKNLLTTQYLGRDLAAGITVAFIAIPLSLAIALASGVSPAAGIVTAIVAGIVCALFGGSALSVSGPAAAMSVLLADTVEKMGVEGLVFACLLAGLMQLVSGVLGLGKLGRYVPIPVIAGFTAGIGVIILIGQLPRAFGLLPPPESSTIDVLTHIFDYFSAINWKCFGLVIATIVIIRGLPKLFPRLPAILIAVIVISAVVYFFKLTDIPLIGNIPRTLPMPTLPLMPHLPFSEIVISAFTIYLLASLETLLSTTAIDKLTHAKRHDANQELIGQGLGNVAVSLFGGIPVTGVIARSVTNVRAGAKTRRASIIHSLIILLAVVAIAPIISMIPIVALAGVLFSIAFSMINFTEFKNLMRTDRSEGLIYAITFLTIVFTDLLAGVQVGMVAAGLIVLFKATKTHFHITSTSADGIIRLSVNGALTFLSATELSRLESKLENAQPNQTVILDLSAITNLDSSGASGIMDLYEYCKDRQIHFFIKGLPRRFEQLIKFHGDDILEKIYLVSESELKSREVIPPATSSRERLIHGVNLFYNETTKNDKRLFDYIAAKQDPHTLFIACSDSRIIPTQLTSTDPGELFTIRNVGNYIPPYDKSATFSEVAALEFALSNLNITDILICGHTNCGAMNACMQSDISGLSPHLQAWIARIKSQLVLNPKMTVNDIARMNVLNQIANLNTYPIIKEKRLAGKSINIHGWFISFDENQVYEWNNLDTHFKPIVSNE